MQRISALCNLPRSVLHPLEGPDYIGFGGDVTAAMLAHHLAVIAHRVATAIGSANLTG
jgi:hypothetical protein